MWQPQHRQLLIDRKHSGSNNMKKFVITICLISSSIFYFFLQYEEPVAVVGAPELTDQEKVDEEMLKIETIQNTKTQQHLQITKDGRQLDGNMELKGDERSSGISTSTWVDVHDGPAGKGYTVYVEEKDFVYKKGYGSHAGIDEKITVTEFYRETE